MRPVEPIIFTENELRQIAVKVAAALRNHPEVEGGVSVRATMSFLDVLKAIKLMGDTISIQTIYDTAFSTFGGRIRSRDWIKTEDIVHEVLDNVLCEMMNDKITRVEGTNMLRAKVGETGFHFSSLMESLEDGIRSERPDPINQNSVQDKTRAPASAMFQVGKEELKKLLKTYYRGLIGNHSNNILEKINRVELERLLNELEAMFDLIQSSNIVSALESNKHWYRKQFPTLFRAMRKLAPIVSNHNNCELSGINSTIPETINALFEALKIAKYLESEGNDLYLSSKAYDLVFKDVLPQVEKTFIKGEHDAVTFADNRGEGEVIDIRKYNRSDRFKDIAIGATLKELIKHRRRIPETQDFRVNKLLPKRSLDIALAIDSSRSMAPHKKLLYAKKAAVGLALAASKIGDRVKVLAFSDFATSIVNVRLKVDKRFLRKITRIRPLNSTNVEAALKKGTEIINNRNAGGQGHIILITDGISTSCSAFFNSKTYPSRITSIKAAYTQAKRCRSEGISISTICIDVDEHIDRDFCLTLSRLGKGRSYFLKDPRKLPNATLHEYSKMKSSIV